MKVMDISVDSAFGDVREDARPLAEAVDSEVEKGHGMLGGSDKGSIIRVPDIGHPVSGGDRVAKAVVINPTDEGFDNQGE